MANLIDDDEEKGERRAKKDAGKPGKASRGRDK